MTYIPKRIIVVDENDLEKSKANFLKWSGGKDYDVEFLTINQATAKGIDLAKIDPFDQMSDTVLSEESEIIVAKLKRVVRSEMQSGQQNKRKKSLKRGSQQHQKGTARSRKRAKSKKLRYK